MEGGASRLWWAWATGLLVLAAGLLLAAALWLDDARVGAAAFGGSGGCESSIVGGLVLLAAAGAALRAAAASADRRVPGAVVTWDWARVALSLPVPAAGLALTGPGLLGCAAAERIERFGSLGEALLGTPGAALGAACALALGSAVAAGARVESGSAAVYVAEDAADDVDPSELIVERALAQAEELEQSGDASRFRGVDS